jgi:hypothetical protein
MRHGLTPSPDTDGAKLLQACQLTATQQTGILQALRLEAKLGGKVFAKPEYQTTLDALEMLAQTLSMQDNEDRGTRKRPALMTDVAPKYPRNNQPKGHGKGQSSGPGKGPGWTPLSSGGVCKFWVKGTCSKGEACSFKHSKGPKGGKPTDGKKGGKGACHQWTKGGSCTFGDKCRFSHEGKGGKGAPGKATPPVVA